MSGQDKFRYLSEVHFRIAKFNMSRIFYSTGIGDTDGSEREPQAPSPSPSVTSAIGVTYVPSGENLTLRMARDEAEHQVILHTLQCVGWNRKRAAAVLKISYRGLLYKIRRHRITPANAR